MGWSIGSHNGRDIGYGVPATCDHPGCGAEIHRGLSYVCGGEPYGGDTGCGLFFCGSHRHYSGKRDTTGAVHMAQHCARCRQRKPPFKPTPDVAEWIEHKATDPSWAEWRASQSVGAEVEP